MRPEITATVLLMLGGAAVWTARELWRRLRFRMAVVPGVVSAHQPEALEVKLRGRDEALRRLGLALSANRVLVIGGWAGIGKTTLGRALAEELEPMQTAIWVDCKKGMGLESLINALASFFGVEYQGFAYILEGNLVRNPDEAVAAFVSELDHGRNVLFLDDFHVVTDRSVIQVLLRALRLRPGKARTVILTRDVNELKEALASKGAQVTYAEELVLPSLDREGSLELLHDRGLRDSPDEDLVRLYEKTRGHPQGLELCAGLLRDGMPIEEIEALPLFQRSGDEEKSLRRVLQETEKRLSPAELHLLRRCSVFDEPFDERAMAAVCPMERCTEVAQKVERRFLLSPRNGHYELHPLLREYFCQGLKDDVPLVHGLAGQYYLTQADKTHREGERLTIRLKAHRHMELAGDNRQLVALFRSVFEPLERTGRWVEGRRICQLSLHASRALGDRKRESYCLGGLGIVYLNQGEAKKAIEYFCGALEISREVSDRRMEAGTLGNLGNAYASLRKPLKAVEYYQQALEMAIERGDRGMVGITLGNMGLAYADLGEPQNAIGNYKEALVIARETGDPWAEVNHLGNLGIAYADLAKPEKAREHYQQSLELARRIGDRRGEANAPAT
jgi:Flp pilus assembly protein TadD